jgi:heat shock protein HtpX
MNVGAYFFSDKLVLRMSGARPIERAEAPRLYGIVEDLAQRAGISDAAPLLDRCALCERLRDRAEPRERRRRGHAASSTCSTSAAPRRARARDLAHQEPRSRSRRSPRRSPPRLPPRPGALVLCALRRRQPDDDEGAARPADRSARRPVVATLIQLGVSRSREYLADETGARISGDPEALANALARLERGAEARPVAVEPATASLFIVNPLSGATVAGLFSTHPPMKERIERLLQMAGELRRGAA